MERGAKAKRDFSKAKRRGDKRVVRTAVEELACGVQDM